MAGILEFIVSSGCSSHWTESTSGTLEIQLVLVGDSVELLDST